LEGLVFLLFVPVVGGVDGRVDDGMGGLLLDLGGTLLELGDFLVNESLVLNEELLEEVVVDEDAALCAFDRVNRLQGTQKNASTLNLSLTR